MRTHKITKWDAGNDLASLADTLSAKEEELRGEYPALATVLHAARMDIGSAFNRLEEHSFTLPDLDSCPCARCELRRS